ncbi:MAG: XdhC family protein [Rhodospirillales bacterium]
MTRDMLARLLALQAAGGAFVVASDVETGAMALLADDEASGDFEPDTAVREAAGRALASDAPVLAEDAAGRPVFLDVHAPPPRLIIVGAVHIAEPLTAIAALAGYRVTIVDPRSAFASRARFGTAEVVAAWPDEALAGLAPDARTAIVTLTHDPKLDDVALATALASPAFYIGCLGSRKTQAARRARLAAAGFTEADLARLRGPVGLAIGARTPAEIAIAIAAEMTCVRRNGALMSPGS